MTANPACNPKRCDSTRKHVALLCWTLCAGAAALIAAYVAWPSSRSLALLADLAFWLAFGLTAAVWYFNIKWLDEPVAGGRKASAVGRQTLELEAQLLTPMLEDCQ